ncbi:MAG: sulfatase-like hydrolase/transferase [Acidobacteria bacterium]|nr:sulfatase-like hydrolase/transferase [Acidobacteriota bacterium]
MRQFRGAVLWLLLLAGAGSCQRQQAVFSRLEIPAARPVAQLPRDGSGEAYFQRPGLSFRYGRKGRGLRLVSPLRGLCRLDLHFWSPAGGRVLLRVCHGGGDGGVFLEKEFAVGPGLRSLGADIRLARGDRLILEADPGGVFSRPLLYPLLAAAERRNIFLISADNLGADHLELYGYPRTTAPAVTQFRRDCVLFRWAFANSPWTLPSHMSLFTSLHEAEHRVTFRVQNEEAAAAGAEPVVQAFPLALGKEFLVERLSASFITCGFSGGINLAAPFGFYRGFDLYLEAPDDHLNPDSAARLFARTEKHLLESRFPAAFYFLHTYQVHLPYRPPRELLERTGRPGGPRAFDFEKDLGGISGIFRGGDERRRADAVALYDAEVMEFDRRFGGFISFLKRNGLYERSMIILLADHGEEFLEHGSWAHGTDLFNSQVRVPLLVKFPGGHYAGRSFAGAVSLVDVLPSVLDYFNINAAPGLGGRSLLGELRGGPPRPEPVFAANLACRSWSRIPAQAALVQDGYKLVRQFPLADSGPRFFAAPPPVFPARQLFRLAGDPGERLDLATRLPRLAARLDARLQAFLGKATDAVPGRPQALPAETLDILRSLGYIR